MFKVAESDRSNDWLSRSKIHNFCLILMKISVIINKYVLSSFPVASGFLNLREQLKESGDTQPATRMESAYPVMSLEYYRDKRFGP